jgi:hypothetical protein
MWGLDALHIRLPAEKTGWESTETLPSPRKQAERLRLTRNQHYSFGLPKTTDFIGCSLTSSRNTSGRE